MKKELRMRKLRTTRQLRLPTAVVIVCLFGCVLLPSMAAAAPPSNAELAKLLETMRAVDKQGVGHEAAATAWERLAQCNAQQLPTILAGMDQANPLAANWIRTAAEKIVARELAANSAASADGTSGDGVSEDTASKSYLPCVELEKFVFDTTHAPKPRRLAYEWLLSQDPTARERIIPKMLDDASLEMRRDAVQRLMEKAGKITDKKDAAKIYNQALASARDDDQVRRIVARLKKLGVEVDLPRTFGFVMNWKVAGPFDNTEGVGFDAVYGPETASDFSAAEKWKGKHDAVKVVDVVAKGNRGEVDFNKALGQEKEVVAYATCRFMSASKRPVQFRLTTHNALKVWLNGKPVAEYETYHSGGQFDQYVCNGTLNKGANNILVKICQNKQKQEWAKAWNFCLRVCDKLGGAVLSTDRK